MAIFDHDFFTIGICYPQKSLCTDKLEILYYIIFKNGNSNYLFHRLVAFQNFKKNRIFYYTRYIMMIFDHDFSTFGVYYLQKSLCTDKLEILYYTIFKNGNNYYLFHRLVAFWNFKKMHFLLYPLHYGNFWSWFFHCWYLLLLPSILIN